MAKITEKQAASVLLGLAVGDALGVPVEFKQRGSFRVTNMQGYGSHNQPPGTWSDDTSLALCLADSLLRGFDTADIARNFVRWHDEGAFTAHGEVFDIGISTAKAISRLKAGVAPEKAGCAGVNENGNGSLMRIAPLVFYVASRPQEERFETIRKVSSITHAHPISITACIIYIEYLIKLLKGEEKFASFEATQKQVMDALMKGSLKNYYKNEITDYFMPLIFPGHKYHLLHEDYIISDGFVVNTLNASIWCFLTTDSYRDAVLKAVNLGSDTDTTAAVTGAMAGLYYGLDGIPAEWLQTLAQYEYLRSLYTNKSGN